MDSPTPGASVSEVCKTRKSTKTVKCAAGRHLHTHLLTHLPLFLSLTSRSADLPTSGLAHTPVATRTVHSRRDPLPPRFVYPEDTGLTGPGSPRYLHQVGTVRWCEQPWHPIPVRLRPVPDWGRGLSRVTDDYLSFRCQSRVTTCDVVPTVGPPGGCRIPTRQGDLSRVMSGKERGQG